jgi:hypothetical protein
MVKIDQFNCLNFEAITILLVPTKWLTPTEVPGHLLSHTKPPVIYLSAIEQVVYNLLWIVHSVWDAITSLL